MIANLRKLKFQYSSFPTFSYYFLFHWANFICCKIYLCRRIIIASQNSDEFILMFDVIEIISSSYHFLCVVFGVLHSWKRHSNYDVYFDVSKNFLTLFPLKKNTIKQYDRGKLMNDLKTFVSYNLLLLRLVNECRVVNWSV